jgi:predicted amidohydrolase YtcJ
MPNVMGGIQCAVTRCDLKGNGPYLPTEAFTVKEALDSFTKEGAKASFEETIKGQIKPGMLADFVVLGENPFETESSKLKEIPVLATYLDGRPVYQS